MTGQLPGAMLIHVIVEISCNEKSGFLGIFIHFENDNVTGPPGALLFDRDQRSH